LIDVVLIATVKFLPELVTGLSSVTFVSVLNKTSLYFDDITSEKQTVHE
jgi:hypothetical protein